MILHPKSIEARKLFGAHHGFTVCNGACYIGGYIGYEKSKGDWIKKWMDKWERDIRAVTKTAGKDPQESYAMVDHAIKS